MLMLTRKEKTLVLLGLGVMAYLSTAWLTDFGMYGKVAGVGFLIAYAALAVPYLGRHARVEQPGDLHLR